MTATQDPPFSPLVADILTAMMSQTHAVTDCVINNLTAEASESRARVAAIRWSVQLLLDADYLPHPDAIQAALYPPATLVDHFRRDGAS